MIPTSIWREVEASNGEIKNAALDAASSGRDFGNPTLKTGTRSPDELDEIPARHTQPAPLPGRDEPQRHVLWFVFYGQEQFGNRKLPTLVDQLKDPVLFRYSVVYQKVQSSPGSRAIAL